MAREWHPANAARITFAYQTFVRTLPTRRYLFIALDMPTSACLAASKNAGAARSWSPSRHYVHTMRSNALCCWYIVSVESRGPLRKDLGEFIKMMQVVPVLRGRKLRSGSNCPGSALHHQPPKKPRSFYLGPSFLLCLFLLYSCSGCFFVMARNRNSKH